MTSELKPRLRSTSARSTDASPTFSHPLLALSGVAFAVLLLLGWFLSGGNTPDYTASDEDWTSWAGDVGPRSGIGGFLILLGGVAFLHFAGTIRSTFGERGADCSRVRDAGSRGVRGRSRWHHRYRNGPR
jgi:hypothetical protein